MRIFAIVSALVGALGIVGGLRSESAVYYEVGSGALEAEVTITLYNDDEPCWCDPPLVELFAGCPASGSALFSVSGSIDTATGEVYADFGNHPGLDPEICGQSVTIRVTCSDGPQGQTACKQQEFCIQVSCV